MVFLNTSETIGILIGTATTYTTGSMFLTLFIIMVTIIAVAMLFGIRMEFTAILILPLLLTYMAYYGEFIVIGALILIYLALIFTQKFIFR